MAYRLHRYSAIAIFFALITGCSDAKDTWKPSGDGKTIVNTSTGEIRDTRTGLSVEELRLLRQKESEAEAERTREERRRWELELNEQNEQRKLEQARLDNERRRQIEELERGKVEAERKFENHCRRIKELVILIEENGFDPPGFGTGSWNANTMPYRLDQQPSSAQLRGLLVLMVEFPREEAFRVKSIQKDASKVGMSVNEFCAKNDILPPKKYGANWDQLTAELKAALK